MSARITVKRTVKEFGDRKIDVNPDWVVTQGDRQVFQHPENKQNSFNGEEVEDATVNRTWKVMQGDEVVLNDFMWDSVMASEAADIIEPLFGGTYEEFRAAFRDDAVKAKRIFLLAILKRTNSNAKLKDADFPANTPVIDYDDEDVIDTGDTSDPADPSSGAPDVASVSETDSASTPEPSPTTSE